MLHRFVILEVEIGGGGVALLSLLLKLHLVRIWAMTWHYSFIAFPCILAI